MKSIGLLLWLLSQLGRPRLAEPEHLDYLGLGALMLHKQHTSRLVGRMARLRIAAKPLANPRSCRTSVSCSRTYERKRTATLQAAHEDFKASRRRAQLLSPPTLAEPQVTTLPRLAIEPKPIVALVCTVLCCQAAIIPQGCKSEGRRANLLSLPLNNVQKH